MKTSEFLHQIKPHAEKFLRFRNHRGECIHPSYHVTEVKAASWRTVDCGNMVHHWNETILQLWLSGNPDAEKAMTILKVIHIIEKVASQIDIDFQAELLIEYGDEDFPPAHFPVGMIIAEGDEVVVSLIAPTTSCKLEARGGSCARPQDRAVTTLPACGESSTSCCS
jgi:hypothetical protein